MPSKTPHIYCILLSKRVGKEKVWVIENNGEIQFTYKDADKRSISRDLFRHAIDQLLNRGIINAKPGNPLKIELINNWEKYDKNDFKSGVRNIMSVPHLKSQEPMMKNQKEADYMKFCLDIKEMSIVVLIEEAIETKESYESFINNLKHWCRANRRKHILKIHRFYKNKSNYEDPADSISSNTG